MKEYRKKNRDKLNKANKERREKIKIIVLTKYGNGKLACVHCGFDDLRALCIDHIDGGGKEEYDSLPSPDAMYRKLIKNNYPKGYQTLCMNCNWIKRDENKELEKSFARRCQNDTKGIMAS